MAINIKSYDLIANPGFSGAKLKIDQRSIDIKKILLKIDEKRYSEEKKRIG